MNLFVSFNWFHTRNYEVMELHQNKTEYNPIGKVSEFTNNSPYKLFHCIWTSYSMAQRLLDTLRRVTRAIGCESFALPGR